MRTKKQYHARVSSKNFNETKLGWKDYKEHLRDSYLRTEEYLFERAAIIRDTRSGDGCQAVLCMDGIAIDYRYYHPSETYNDRGSNGVVYILLGSDLKSVTKLARKVGNLSDLLMVDIFKPQK